METKKIVSTLLAAGMAVPALPIYAYADSSASLPESATKIDNDNTDALVANSTNIKIAASTEFADNAWNYGKISKSS